MKKITTIIIDDKNHVIDSLSSILKRQCPEIELKGSAGSVEKGVELIKETHPDLIFLDVELPDGYGFDVLNRSEFDAAIVFITSYSDYAIKAFQFSAIHYLLKPLEEKSIVEAVNRYHHYYRGQELDRQLEVLDRNFKQGKKKIALPTKKCLEIVNMEDIIYFESVRNYLIFYMMDNQEIVVTGSMNEYEQILESDGFFRIHHSYMVNLKHIKRYTRGRGGYVKLVSGVELDVSTRRKQAFLAQLNAL